MPPKVKTTKRDIIKAATELVRTSGAAAINARAIARMLGSSTQPIFSNFEDMEKVRDAVIGEARRLYSGYVEREIESKKYPIYKASGMGYIRFASEEPELFRLLYMRDRSGIDREHEDDEIWRGIIDTVREVTGLSDENSQLFHIEMWMIVHGIATAIATGYLDIGEELISKMITDAYQGLRSRFGLGGQG